MKVPILNTKNENKGEQNMPAQFTEPVREDIIHRAVIAKQANDRQAYGADDRAGLKHSTKVSKRRRDYRGSYGIGISRTPRKVTSRSGTRMNWTGAEAPNTVGGRRAHPPKADKVWDKKINVKEKRKALRSAMAATVSAEWVAKRGHAVPKNYPFVVDADCEALAKSKDVDAFFKSVGLTDELARSAQKNVRAGKGKTRGRKYTKATGPLIVVGTDCKLVKAAQNIAGVDIIDVKHLNAELLAPGAQPGRLTLWTTSALQLLEKEKLYS